MQKYAHWGYAFIQKDKLTILILNHRFGNARKCIKYAFKGLGSKLNVLIGINHNTSKAFIDLL